MRVFNGTPYRSGQRLAMYQPGSPFMTVYVKGTFALTANGSCRALPPKKQVKVGKSTAFMDEHGNSLKVPADTVPFKLRSDCLFVGSAHAPSGRPVETLDVSFAVGPMRKTLTVVGDRDWVRVEDGSVHLTAPVPFTEMPIRAEYAHGGFASKYNRHGIGFEPLAEEAGSRVAAANILPEGLAAEAWNEDGPHAGFGMLAPTLLPRKKLLGTTDQKWMMRRRPLPPEDFDVAFFNAAPMDQQIEGYLVGDEEILLTNLHPEAPEFRTQLPGTRVRCFVNRHLNPDHPKVHDFAEVRTVLDTCIVDVPQQILILVWRGTIEIKNRQDDRIDQLLIVEEPVSKPAAPEVYAALLGEKLIDKRAVAAEEEALKRAKKVAELKSQGLNDAVTALKEGGAPKDLIAEVERQDSLEGAQKAITDWVEAVSAGLEG